MSRYCHQVDIDLGKPWIGLDGLTKSATSPIQGFYTVMIELPWLVCHATIRSRSILDNLTKSATSPVKVFIKL